MTSFKKISFLLIIFCACFFIYSGWKLYVSNSTFIKIPINISASNTPELKVTIRNHILCLCLDLGSKHFLSLNKNILNKLSKKPNGTVKWRDYKGDPYEADSYLIPEMNIEGLSLKNVETKELSETYTAASYLWKDTPNGKKESVGYLGLPLLEKCNLCLDFQHKNAYFCKSLKTLQNKGIFPKNLIKVPFKKIKGLMLVEAVTDLGKLNLAIGTQASISVVKPSFIKDDDLIKNDAHGFSFCPVTNFELEGKNFGNLNLYKLNMLDNFDIIDGVLGMDFLMNHTMYIDYKNNFIYIADS